MMRTFSFLHISDLHERGPRERERPRRYRVLGEAWRQNLDDLCADGKIDFICFTGDLVDWGKSEEFERINPFLEKLIGHLGLDRSRLFVVPGNHDVDRSIGATEWKNLRSNFHEVDTLRISRWLELGKTPWGFQDSWLDMVLERQANYRRWLEQFGLGNQVPSKSDRRIGYRLPLLLPGFPFRIHIIGLDSAWLSGDDADAGKLRLTDGQVQSLCRDVEEGRPLDGFRLALVHHPLTDIADGAECRRLLANSVDLLLRGHLHDTESELWADPDHTLRAMAAGCLYEGDAADRYPNSCVLVRVTCDDYGRPESYELRFRSFSARSGHWCDDTALYRGAPQGRLRIRVDSDLSKQQTVSASNALMNQPVPPVLVTNTFVPIRNVPVLHTEPVHQSQSGPSDPSQTPGNVDVAKESPERAMIPAVRQAGIFTHPLQPNSQVADYRIIRLIGQGGMGSVYEAIKISIDRRVALKFLHTDAARHQDAIHRFINEAKASSRIEHPSIVEVSESNQTTDGTPYLVMEFLRGESLAARLRRVHNSQQKLPLVKVLQIAWQAADALVAAHAKGIIHRDLKPDNVMLVVDPVAPGRERVKLLDFGIAKLTAEVTAAQPMTANNQLLGTPMYMSPEQCRSAANVDHKSDVYALGVVIYEMLAGRPPFLAEQMVQFLAQHLFEPPPPLTTKALHAPLEVSELVHRMLAKDKSARPTMEEAAKQLEKLLGNVASNSGLKRFSYTKHIVIGSSVLLVAAFLLRFHAALLSTVGIGVSPPPPQGKAETVNPAPIPETKRLEQASARTVVDPIRLTMTIKPEKVREGGNVQVRIASTERVYLLLLGLEQSGHIGLLAPWGPRPVVISPQAPLSFPPNGNGIKAMLPRGVNQTTESLWAIGVKNKAAYDELCTLAQKAVTVETLRSRLMELPESDYAQERHTYQIIRESK